MIIYNGELHNPEYFPIPFANRSFKYGDGLFETILIRKGKSVFLDEHLNRLFAGMRIFQLEFSPVIFRRILEGEIQRIIRANNIQENGRMRVHVFRNGQGAYLPTTNTPNYLIEATTIPDPFADLYSVSLIGYPSIPLQPSPLSGFKTANALPFTLAALYAQQKNFDRALLFSNGYVSEAHNANIFIVRKQKVYTPPLGAACIDGIMRRYIFDLCNQLRISCSEKWIKEKDIYKADEIFLTNSIQGIVPVDSYQEKQLWPGNYTITPFLQNCLYQYLESSYD